MIRKINSVLITGITGFVGSHLADYILDKHENVKIYGLARWRSPTDNIKRIQDNIYIKYGDLTDLSSIQTIIENTEPDAIFHLAAQSYVPYSFNVPIATLDANINGTCNLLEAVKKSNVYNKPIIHICSSSEVYGQVKEDEVPITENNSFRPASPYAVSKVGEDMLAQQYYLSWKLKTIRTRMFTHTGPRRGSVFVVSNFAKQIAEIEVGLKKPQVMVGNLNSIRTFADVRDAVRAYWLLVTRCPIGEVYNIGGTTTMTIGKMLDKLISMSTVDKIDIEIDEDRLRPSDVTLQIPCIDKFQKETKWKPVIPFEKTLEDTLNYWREYYNDNS